jgi:hypothetical protein
MRERSGRGTIQGVYWVLLLAAGAILGGVVVVAMGRGGEMAVFSRDLPASATNPRSPMEVATQRLPRGPIGYQPQATEEALLTAASLLAERDQEIAALRTEVWRLGGDPSVRHDRPATEFDDRLAPPTPVVQARVVQARVVQARVVQASVLPGGESASVSEPPMSSSGGDGGDDGVGDVTAGRK